MLWLLTASFALIAFYCAWVVLRIRRKIMQLNESVREGKQFLSESPPDEDRWLGLPTLATSVNSLIKAQKEARELEDAASFRVGAMLDAVQEVVLIFNQQRIVEYANQAAETLFRNGRSIQGNRLEGTVRSLSLLELLNQNLSSGETTSAQISIEQGGQTRWFEATCSQVKQFALSESDSTLMILHDITKLKSLEEMRREFIANVSHELRTPLTVIKGFTETLIDGDGRIQLDARQRFLEKIQENAERLQVLVEDLLTLSRLESKSDPLETTEQPFGPFLGEVADNYRPRLDARKQTIEVCCAPEVKAVAFDRHRLHQVLDNLLENVFRYAPDFTRIKLEAVVDPSDGSLVCSVSDDGPGIPEKDLPHLFERFYRVDKGRSRETGGTGLGLSIVKHIIQLHGGTVHAESKVREGTRVVFRIPQKRVDEIAQP